MIKLNGVGMVRALKLRVVAVCAATFIVASASPAKAQLLPGQGPAYEAALQEIADMEGICAARGDALSFQPGHMVEVNFSDDGVPDYVILANQIRCGQMSSLFCGSGGCAVAAFASLAKGVVRGDYLLHNPESINGTIIFDCRPGQRGRLEFDGAQIFGTGC